MSLAKELCQKRDSLYNERTTFEHHWSEVAPLVLPRQDDFFSEKREEGDKRTREKFDDTATLALERGSAAIEGILIPRGQMWHGIDLPEDIRDDHEAQIWADDLKRFLFRKRYAPHANFASQAHEFIMSLLAFGTAVMLVEDVVGHGIRYSVNHIGEHCVMENAVGRIDTTYRKYKMTARQAKERFREKTPEIVEKALEKDPNQKFEFLHVVMPDISGEAPDGMDFVSYHVFYSNKEMIDVGGYRTFPYIVSRWNTAPNERYGRSPAMNVLSEIKMLNSMRKTDIKARHLAVDPPILAADQHTIRRLTMKSGAINYGTMDMNGRPLVQPYQSGVNIGVSDDTLDQSREVINRAFFLDLFQILVDSPQMTATEVLQRSQEKGTLLSPSAGRQKSEFLDPLVEREISIYEQYGIFEDDGILPMPQSIKDMGGEFAINYLNPITFMQLSEEALSTERTVQALIPVAQIEPRVLKTIDWMEYANIHARANGVPPALIKSPEVMEAELQAEQQQQQMQQMVEAAPQVAGALESVAKAQSLQS